MGLRQIGFENIIETDKGLFELAKLLKASALVEATPKKCRTIPSLSLISPT